MKPSWSSLRWTALTAMGILAGFLGFLTAVQLLLMLLPPGGTWQKPAIYQVTVKQFDPSPNAKYPYVQVTDSRDKERSLLLLTEERLSLQLDEDIWVLDVPFRTNLRPPTYRVTPQRLLLEFPEPALALVLLLIWVLRRVQVRVAKEEAEAPRQRTVLKDDFHTRAQRRD